MKNKILSFCSLMLVCLSSCSSVSRQEITNDEAEKIINKFTYKEEKKFSYIIESSFEGEATNQNALIKNLKINSTNKVLCDLTMDNPYYFVETVTILKEDNVINPVKSDLAVYESTIDGERYIANECFYLAGEEKTNFSEINYVDVAMKGYTYYSSVVEENCYNNAIENNNSEISYFKENDNLVAEFNISFKSPNLFIVNLFRNLALNGYFPYNYSGLFTGVYSDDGLPLEGDCSSEITIEKICGDRDEFKGNAAISFNIEYPSDIDKTTRFNQEVNYLRSLLN